MKIDGNRAVEPIPRAVGPPLKFETVVKHNSWGNYPVQLQGSSAMSKIDVEPILGHLNRYKNIKILQWG